MAEGGEGEDEIQFLRTVSAGFASRTSSLVWGRRPGAGGRGRAGGRRAAARRRPAGALRRAVGRRAPRARVQGRKEGGGGLLPPRRWEAGRGSGRRVRSAPTRPGGALSGRAPEPQRLPSPPGSVCPPFPRAEGR